MDALLYLLPLTALVAGLLPPTQVVDQMSQAMAHKMFECAREMYPGVGFVREILDFWNMEYDFSRNEPLGCLQACSVHRLQLRDADGALNLANIRQFILTHGGDEETVETLTKVLERCHLASRNTTRACSAGVKEMQCFRNRVYELRWVPDVQFGPYDNIWSAGNKGPPSRI
ncbi:pheromone-binding protein-like [Battus philenor]|uniref:pheromone-binding protein-like n=1 Tax=Battus philenor TaxID=42288 RepID=UPI0035CF26F3